MSALGAFLLATTSLSARAEVIVDDGESIAFLGDSITAAGWADAGGYVKLVVDGLAKVGITAEPIPAGIGGHKSNDMLARLERDVLSKSPDWMFLSCGVNDVWHGPNGVDLENYSQNITEIVDRAMARGVKVVLLTPTPIFEGVDNPQNTTLASYNEFLRSLARERQLPLADLNQKFLEVLTRAGATNDSRVLTVDGVHMNPEGNVLMALGCLEALGLDGRQLADVERAWLAQSDTALFSVGNFDPRARIGITLGQYRALKELADERGVDVDRFAQDVWLRALHEILDRHSADSVFDPEQVKKQTTELLEARLNLLTPAE